jgi:hypothetical protein
MIGIAAWFKLDAGIFVGQEVVPYANAVNNASGKP